MIMTQHDQISAFIDNELTGEQEQDFLISLASSEGLRKSFRSELVLKNVIHRDEVLTTPSRKMRGAVLTTLGIGAAALASETADAATTAVPAAKATFVKTLFASKLNAIITASMVTASAIGGYGIHSLVAEKNVRNTMSTPTHITQPLIKQEAPQEIIPPVSNTDQSHASAPKRTSVVHHTSLKQTEPSTKNTDANTTSGIAPAKSNPPVMDTQKK
jgi:negative regulator of sigma E activity